MTNLGPCSLLMLTALPACVLIDYEATTRDAGTPPRDGGSAPQVDAAALDAAMPDTGVTLIAPAPTCKRGEWCSYHCGGALGACNFTCRAGEQCEVRCAGDSACQGIVCEKDAVCALYCVQTQPTDRCNVECGPSVSCPGTTAWCGSCLAPPIATQ